MIIWGIAVLLIKVTILLQYVRVFVPEGTRNFTFWASYGLLYTNIAYYVAFTFLEMFCCTPRAKFWDKTITDGYCIDVYALNLSGAVVCHISDLAILLLPHRVVFNLHLPLSKRLGLGALFTVGILSVLHLPLLTPVLYLKNPRSC
jgi:hypothetical protein